MDFATGLPKKIFDLLDNTPFGAVLTVQKRGNDGDAQFRPAWTGERGSR